jgi:hypothetical protein
VAGGEGCYFVQEEELGVAVRLHELPATTLKFEDAGNPALIDPWTARANLLALIVQAAAAVSEHRAALTDRLKLAKRVDPVLQRPGFDSHA